MNRYQIKIDLNEENERLVSSSCWSNGATSWTPAGPTNRADARLQEVDLLNNRKQLLVEQREGLVIIHYAALVDQYLDHRFTAVWKLHRSKEKWAA